MKMLRKLLFVKDDFKSKWKQFLDTEFPSAFVTTELGRHLRKGVCERYNHNINLLKDSAQENEANRFCSKELIRALSVGKCSNN
jgi:hypothetical protein